MFEVSVAEIRYGKFLYLRQSCDPVLWRLGCQHPVEGSEVVAREANDMVEASLSSVGDGLADQSTP